MFTPIEQTVLGLVRKWLKGSWLVSEMRRFTKVQIQAYPNSGVHILNIQEPHRHSN